MSRRSKVVPLPGFATFLLTPDSLAAGGRRRDPDEACLNAKSIHYDFFGGKRDIVAVPDRCNGFTVRFPGAPARGVPGVPKNGRPVLATELGACLRAGREQPESRMVGGPLGPDRDAFQFGLRALTRW